jgi:hypothetical protein
MQKIAEMRFRRQGEIERRNCVFWWDSENEVVLRDDDDGQGPQHEMGKAQLIAMALSAPEPFESKSPIAHALVALGKQLAG